MALSGVALVTGGGSGIGQEVAFAFAEGGCKAVAVADINEEHAQKTAQKSREYATDSKYHSFAIHVDVVSEESVKHMVEIAVERLGGRIDYFVNCAGISDHSNASVSEIDTELLDRIMRVNLYGTINCMKAVSKAMQSQEPIPFIPSTPRTRRNPERTLGRGSIVNLGSVSSVLANPGNMSYVTSKHAILAATKVAALDLAKDLIRVNVILPGPTDTPLLEIVFERLPGLKEQLEAMTPLSRLASTDEIADMIVHICSPAASFMTGSTIVIDGGVTARL